MQLNWVERVYMRSPLRRLALRKVSIVFRQQLADEWGIGTVLDLGCGDGRGTVAVRERLGAARVVALDVDEASVRRARRTLRDLDGSHVAVGDATALPFSDGQLSVVFDFGALHHVENWEAALDEIRRVLRPGGWFAFEEVSQRTLERPVARRLTRHPATNRFDASSFVQALAQRGIVGTDVTTRWTPWRDLVLPMGDIVGVGRKHAGGGSRRTEREQCRGL